MEARHCFIKIQLRLEEIQEIKRGGLFEQVIIDNLRVIKIKIGIGLLVQSDYLISFISNYWKSSQGLMH